MPKQCKPTPATADRATIRAAPFDVPKHNSDQPLFYMKHVHARDPQRRLYPRPSVAPNDTAGDLFQRIADQWDAPVYPALEDGAQARLCNLTESIASWAEDEPPPDERCCDEPDCCPTPAYMREEVIRGVLKATNEPNARMPRR
jgi:hypothetical protein